MGLPFHIVMLYRHKTPKMDKDEDPEASLMNLMKQMYQDGDNDMKRTIAKAWHESQEKRSREQADDDLMSSCIIAGHNCCCFHCHTHLDFCCFV